MMWLESLTLSLQFMLQLRWWWWFMPRLGLRLWPNGSVRPDAKPWANKDVFACFANAFGINTHQFQSQPKPTRSLSFSICPSPRLWNVLNLQSEAEVCLSDSLSIVYVSVCSSQSVCVSAPPYCVAACVPVYVAVCVRLVCFDDECVPFSLYCCCCHSSCLCKWSTFLSLLCCIAGALAFAYCARPTATEGKALATTEANFAIDSNRLRIEMENAPNYKSKLTSDPHIYVCNLFIYLQQTLSSQKLGVDRGYALSSSPQ